MSFARRFSAGAARRIDCGHLRFFRRGLFLKGMNRLVLSVVVVGLAALSLPACGPSSGSGNCGKVAPCGGNIVGNWTVVDTCLTLTGAVPASPLGDNCPTATFDPPAIDFSGNISYSADMTYSGTLTLSGSMALNIPQSCQTISGVTFTCAQFDQLFKDQLAQNPDPSIQSVSCSGSSGCKCTFVLPSETMTTSGTYTTSGNNLIEDGTSTSAYCVQGSELHISPSTMDGMDVTGAVVLKK